MPTYLHRARNFTSVHKCRPWDAPWNRTALFASPSLSSPSSALILPLHLSPLYYSESLGF
jgi:hypothetical protein